MEGTGSLGGNQARCIEEAIIVNSKKQGIKTINQNHSIDPNRNIHKKSVQWGEDWIKKNNPKLAEKSGLIKGCPP